MNNTEQTSQLNVIRLGGVWLKFLDHAGRYAARYYMSRDLELPPNEQNPGTHLAMVRNYGTEANLLGAIERDLATFPGELRDINAAQAACGLPPFSDRDGYLDQIAMGFTMLDRHGKERREYYRRRINKLFKTLNGGGQVIAPSLNQLEADFQESQRKSAARKAKKAKRAALANTEAATTE